jgi:hypothetical protein
MKRAPCVVGLDLSARAAAMVAVPADWDGQWSRVATKVVGRSLPKTATSGERIERAASIGMEVARFCLRHRAKVAHIEGYAFALRTQAHTLGEIGGIVRYLLGINGIRHETVNMGTARKLLLGKLPRKWSKTVVRGALVHAGAPMGWTLDECDAFVVANFALSDISGAYCFAAGER